MNVEEIKNKANKIWSLKGYRGYRAGEFTQIFMSFDEKDINPDKDEVVYRILLITNEPDEVQVRFLPEEVAPLSWLEKATTTGTGFAKEMSKPAIEQRIKLIADRFIEGGKNAD